MMLAIHEPPTMQMEYLLEELENHIKRATRCAKAREVIGRDTLQDVQCIVDRLRYLIRKQEPSR